MASLESYLDTTLRIIYINRRSGVPPEVIASIRQQIVQSETSTPIRRELILRHLDTEHHRNEELIKVLSHEFYHYLQGLFYPFLYYLSWLEFDNLLYLGNKLKRSDKKFFGIDQIHMHNDFLLNFKFLYSRTDFYFEGDYLRVKIPEAGTHSVNVFCLNDLLEDATTIYEYRVSSEDPSAEGFNLWISNPQNNCYKKTYRFLLTAWDSVLAFKLLPMLVQIAFSVTDPVKGFCNAVSYINSRYSLCYDREPEMLFIEIMAFLEDKIGRVKLDPEKHQFILDIPVGVLRFEDMGSVISKANGSKKSLSYPLNIHFKKIVARIKLEPIHQTIILQLNRGSAAELLKYYTPYAIHYHYDDFDGRNGVLMIGEDYRNKKSPSGIDYPLYIRELIKVKESHIALFSRIHTFLESNCHHKNCSYYPLGLCKLWNSIPVDYVNCGFSDWFAYYFHRRIDLLSKTLIKIDPREAEECYHNYKRFSFSARTYEYVLNKDGYSLTIDKQAITDSRSTAIFADFIAFLKNERNYTNESLSGSISIDFYGFELDARPLFEIPEVVNFIQANKKLIPEILYYINFNSPIDHRFILLPIFIKHETLEKDGQLQIALNPKSFSDFMLREIEIWQDFLTKNNLDPSKKIINNFEKLIYEDPYRR